MKVLRGFFIVFCLALAGCASVQERQNEAISRGVYAALAAEKAGRFDLATSYLDETSRLVAPPKKAVEVKPIVKDGRKLVILPDEFKGAQVSLKPTDRAFLSQFEAEDRDLKAFTNQTNAIVRDEKKEATKYEAQPSFLSRFTHWGLGIGALSVLGIGALCLFCPAVIPFVLNILSAIGAAFNWVFEQLSKLVRGNK